MRIGRSSTAGGDWFLLFALALAPLGLAWFLSTVWPWLAGISGFYATLGLLFVMAIVIGRERNSQ